MTLIEVHANYFTAGLECNPKGIVIDPAPILAYMKGWDIGRVQEYVDKKGWWMEFVIPYSKDEHGKTTTTIPVPSAD